MTFQFHRLDHGGQCFFWRCLGITFYIGLYPMARHRGRGPSDGMEQQKPQKQDTCRAMSFPPQGMISI